MDKSAPKSNPKISVKVEIEGKVKSFEIEESAMVSALKAEIEKKEGLPAADINLFYKEEVLDATKTLSHYGIQSGIQLRATLNQTLVRIYFSEVDKMVEMKICNHFTIPQLRNYVIEKQSYKFGGKMMVYLNGRELQDEESISAYPIREKEILEFRSTNKYVQIYVKSLLSKAFVVQMLTYDTVGMLKARIQKNFKLPIEKLLTLEETPILLEDNAKLEHTVISNDSAICVSFGNVEKYKMPIIVKDPEGKSHKIMVLPNESVVKIKNIMAEIIKIPPDEQLLYFGKFHLESGKGLAEFDIKGHDELKLKKRPKIKIKFPTSIEVLDLYDSETVFNIKERIDIDYYVPTDHLILSYNGRELDNKEMIEDLKLTEDSVIELSTRTFIKITLKLHELMTKEVEVTLLDTFAIVKERVAKVLGVSPDAITLKTGKRHYRDDKMVVDYGIEEGDYFTVIVRKEIDVVVTYDGKKYNFKADLNATAKDLKLKIQERLGIDHSQQSLYMEGDRPLQVGVILSEYYIKPGEQLLLRVKGKNIITVMVLSLHRKGFHCFFDLDDTLYIHHFRALVAKTLKVRNDAFTLYYRNNVFTDGFDVSLYQLQNDDTIFLKFNGPEFERRIRLYLRFSDGDVRQVEADLLESVYQLKRKIIEGGETWMQDNYIFSHAGQLIDDHKFNFYQLGLRNDTTIYIIKPVHRVLLNLKVTDGRRLEVDCLITDTIEEIKRKIQYHHKFPFEHQRLVRGNFILEDDKTLPFYDLEDRDVAYLIMMNEIYIRVQMLTGRISHMKAAPNEQMVSFKEVLESEHQVKYDNQRLIFEGKCIDDAKTLQQVNLGDGAVCHCVDFGLRFGFWKNSKGQIYVIQTLEIETLEYMRERIHSAGLLVEDIGSWDLVFGGRLPITPESIPVEVLVVY